MQSSSSVPFLLGVPVTSMSGTVSLAGGDLTSDVTGLYTMTTNNIFLADAIIPPHSPTPVPVLTVSGAAGAKANS